MIRTALTFLFTFWAMSSPFSFISLCPAHAHAADEDGDNFYDIVSRGDMKLPENETTITELMPVAAGPFVPDAFADTKNGRGITWGLCHNIKAGGKGGRSSVLMRFDCDLSQDVHDPGMKRHCNYLPPDVYYKAALSRAQRERASEATEKLRSN